MKTIAVEIEDDVLCQAEKKASALATSVPHVVADYLRHWSQEAASIEQARQQMTALFEKSGRQFGVGIPDTREERNARR